MIAWVDEEGRHEDLPSLQSEIDLEKEQITKQRDLDIAQRTEKLEADLAELEAEGAKADARRKVRDSAEREMAQIRKRRSEEHTSELQSRGHIVCRLLLEKKKSQK